MGDPLIENIKGISACLGEAGKVARITFEVGMFDYVQKHVVSFGLGLTEFRLHGVDRIQIGNLWVHRYDPSQGQFW